ncbi:MAG: LPXTG cell wall anchor domain-containing protein [Actinomycetota bacterium]
MGGHDMERTTRQKRRLATVAAVGLAVGASVVGLGAGSASAGTDLRGLEVDIFVDGPNAPTVFAGLTVEVYNDGGGGATGSQVTALDCGEMVVSSQPTTVQGEAGCPLEPGDFLVGLDGVPDGWTVGGFCTDGDDDDDERLDLAGQEAFNYAGDGNPTCQLFVSVTTLLIDKVVVGGPASSADFVIEVLDGDTVVASGSDVADATCEADFDLTKCGAIVLAPGTGYTIQEPAVPNYVLTSVECQLFISLGQPPADDLQPIGDEGFGLIDGDTYCVVTNTYVPPPTTTTEPPAATPAPTTAAPTTQPPPPPVEILPETGASSTSTGWIAALGALFIAAGGALVFVRRRPS